MKAKSKMSNHLLRATGTIGLWTLVSRLLGFVRDIFLARLLGASAMSDAFFVAFRIPNFFRRTFAEGTLTVALVPVLEEERRKGKKQAFAYLNALTGVMLFVLVSFTLVGILCMPLLIMLFAPGFHDEPDRWTQTVTLARWMFPYLALISLTALSWGILNCFQRFAVAAATPALLNIAIIFAALVLAPNMQNPAFALAIGVLLGGVLQLAIQLPALKRIGWLPKPTLHWGMPAVRKTFQLFFPALLGVTATQINLLVGTMLATMLSAGAVSYLYYADRIVQLPLALFGIAMGTALLPTLSNLFASGNRSAAHRTLKDGLAWLTWITLPAVAGLGVLAQPIMITLFEHGRFQHSASLASAECLQAYAFGLVAFCWIKALASVCYAEKDPKTPVRCAAVAVAVNIVLSLVLMLPLAHVGLALATSLAACTNAAMLYRHVRKRHGALMDPQTAGRLLRALIATLGMTAFLLAFISWLPFPSQKAWQLPWLSCAVIGGMACFLFSSYLLGERSLARGLFKSKPGKKDLRHQRGLK